MAGMEVRAVPHNLFRASLLLRLQQRPATQSAFPALQATEQDVRPAVIIAAKRKCTSCCNPELC